MFPPLASFSSFPSGLFFFFASLRRDSGISFFHLSHEMITLFTALVGILLVRHRGLNCMPDISVESQNYLKVKTRPDMLHGHGDTK